MSSKLSHEHVVLKCLRPSNSTKMITSESVCCRGVRELCYNSNLYTIPIDNHVHTYNVIPQSVSTVCSSVHCDNRNTNKMKINAQQKHIT